MKTYALYKGDDLLSIGTAKELAAIRGVKESTIIHYSYPAYQRKADKWKKPKARLYAMPIPEDDEDDDQDTD